jgi:hypothetical protein
MIIRSSATRSFDAAAAGFGLRLRDLGASPRPAQSGSPGRRLPAPCSLGGALGLYDLGVPFVQGLLAR